MLAHGRSLTVNGECALCVRAAGSCWMGGANRAFKNEARAGRPTDLQRRHKESYQQ